ncbi:MAG: hypothetical protein ACRD3Q_07815, partial [Terriglobales bacterium]
MSRRPNASTVRGNLVRTYLVAIALAVIPLVAFIVGAHKLLQRETTKSLVSQSSRSGRMFAGFIEQRLHAATAFLQSMAERRDVIELWQAKNTPELGAIVERSLQLWPDFTAVGLYDHTG